MSVNRYLPHVLVLPEDDACRQMAIGFQQATPLPRQIRVEPVAGGWQNVLRVFQSDHVGGMGRYPDRFMVLLIDFDCQEDRRNQARALIPDDLNNRVFVLGVWTEPEDLRANLGSYETIGSDMAKDCREETNTTWGHQLLRHNAVEITRLREHVRPFLFPS